ncbi:uncharacterized protein LOC112351108 [Selaginella moellendorffii]|uniref:uncharacterized protein LOC112351108 n=1 Tax=Selaginella moellendorffii TaxID=88036 RepID=UPI000D1CC4C8|nr:uncharacterized protein LOC112351108 [Selaginella moellendorffii]|eukprot:XP_024544171.1 uncharacterized protein LOC112351108 [Selaginella moellendorffii]
MVSYDAEGVALAILLFIVAGICEVGGGWLVWKWRREGWSWAFFILGSILLVVYGIIPTLQRQTFARTYAAYGGFFIVLSLVWGWITEGARPDVWDVVGSIVALIGVSMIMFARR